MTKIKLILLGVVCLGGALFLWKRETPPTHAARHYPVAEQKSFVIIIPSYNNECYVEKNLRSVFSQNYDNFRVIYIEDNSNDETLKQVGLLLAELDTKKQTSLVHNTENQGGLANIYNAAHTCLDHEIVILLDGDDFLAHENVLKRLNEIYANPDVWLTYGNHLVYPSYLPEKNTTQIDRTRFTPPPLRTFYAALFKEINTQDLIYRGKFYPMAWDLALMLPMIEMAKDHAQFIEETFYLSNHANPLFDLRINPKYHAECEHNIRSKASYRPLKRLGSPSKADREKADLLIFSYDNPTQLYALLESVEQNVLGLNKTSVLYRVSSTHIDTAYLEVKLRFPHVHFIKQESPPQDFKKLINSLIFDPSIPASHHIIFAPDRLIIKEPTDLARGILALEKTHAFALYYGLHEKLQFCSALHRFQPIPVHTPLPGIPAQEPPHLWQFSEGVDDFNTPNSLHFALYRKEDLKKVFQKLDFDTPQTLLYEWGQKPPSSSIGLFFRDAKVVEVVPKDGKKLLEEFNSGLKIDLRPISHTLSPSQKVEKEIVFTSK